jgi:hypothetical protein
VDASQEAAIEARDHNLKRIDSDFKTAFEDATLPDAMEVGDDVDPDKFTDPRSTALVARFIEDYGPAAGFDPEETLQLSDRERLDAASTIRSRLIRRIETGLGTSTQSRTNIPATLE